MTLICLLGWNQSAFSDFVFEKTKAKVQKAI